MPAKISDDAIFAAITEWQTGVPMRLVAARHGISGSCIRDYKNVWGVPRPKRYSSSDPETQARKRARYEASAAKLSGRPRSEETRRKISTTKLPIRYEVVDRGYATPCWIWLGRISSCGYGPHRQEYEKARGPLSKAYHLHHECEQRACVNPDHLTPLTPAAHGALHRKAGQ